MRQISRRLSPGFTASYHHLDEKLAKPCKETESPLYFHANSQSGSTPNMNDVIIYSTGTCPLCQKAKALFTKWGIDYQEKRVDLDRDALKEMMKISNAARTVPQISINGKWIGGFTELTELHMDGKLDDLMPK